MTAKPRKLSREAITEMARFVGLEMTEEQLNKIEPEMEVLARNIETLEAVDLGETEPAILFRPDR